ncbi:MAG: hypothetical protein AAFV29_23160 [Myxococcota bacterium]
MHRISPVLSLVLLAATACGAEETPGLDTAIVSSRSLSADFGGSTSIVGVTVEPNTGRRFVLDDQRGIYEVLAEGVMRVASLDEITAQGDQPQSAFTDFVAIDEGEFALTAMNDGFLYDLETGTLSSYFCYVPGFIDDLPGGDGEIFQLTESVTFDPEANLMFAQPQTFNTANPNDVLLSQIGRFEMTGGEGFGWVDAPSLDFRAGAMAAVGNGKLLLVEGSRLLRVDATTGAVDGQTDLSRLGLQSIHALTYDHTAQSLIAVDQASETLYELDIDLL